MQVINHSIFAHKNSTIYKVHKQKGVFVKRDWGLTDCEQKEKN